MSAFLDLTDKQYDDYYVIGRGPDDSNGLVRWWCRCKCGEKKLVYGTDLRLRKSKRCRKCWAKRGRNWNRQPQRRSLALMPTLDEMEELW